MNFNKTANFLDFWKSNKRFFSKNVVFFRKDQFIKRFTTHTHKSYNNHNGTARKISIQRIDA